MIKIEAKLKYKKHPWTSYSGNIFTYSSCDIDYKFNSNDNDLEMDIDISTALGSEEVWGVFVEILDFLYLAFGTMPIIVYYKENDTEKDLSNIVMRYFPSDQFFKNEHLINISSCTLNEYTLTNVKNVIRNKPFEIFRAFTALTSKAYENIYAEHKITLLLHCFEGYVYNKESSFQAKNVKFKDRISQISDVFSDYDKMYNTEILKTLSVTKDEYSQILSDTRHQFSHYISKQNPLSTGEDYLVHFILLCYIFRIFLLKEINIQPIEKNVEHCLKLIHDWINTLKNPNFKNFKTAEYSINAIFGDFK